MLVEAIEKKKKEETSKRRIEEEQVRKLKLELEAESQRTALKRKLEKQAALKVIHDNELEKKKRL